MNHYRAIVLLLVALFTTAAVPSYGWLYDGGDVQHAGLMVRDNSSAVWAAAPFSVAEDSYATSFGAAIGRALGPVGSGFDVYLTQAMNGLPDTAMMSWKMIPDNSTLSYYYHDLDTPVFLKANAAYALIFMPDSPSFWGSISYSRAGFYGWSTGNYGETWSMLPLPLCVRVDGYAAVPEPGSFAAMIAGVSGLLCIRRRKR